jgi:SAM-dependent methyltransferase
MLDPTQRFSNRVEAYAAARPGYPAALLHFMIQETQLTPKSVIADLGSGTGLLAKLFLDHGNSVYGIEPNREMREAGEEYLKDATKFVSMGTRAEATGLPEKSVDFILAGQAFHWFDPLPTSHEFRRILRTDGWCVVVWNERLAEASPFMAGYTELVAQYQQDRAFSTENRRRDQNALSILFAGDFHFKAFPNDQTLDRKQFISRIESSSYMPAAGTEFHPEMVKAAGQLFDKYEVDGVVVIEHETQAFYGRLL